MLRRNEAKMLAQIRDSVEKLCKRLTKNNEDKEDKVISCKVKFPNKDYKVRGRGNMQRGKEYMRGGACNNGISFIFLREISEEKFLMQSTSGVFCREQRENFYVDYGIEPYNVGWKNKEWNETNYVYLLSPDES